MNKTLAVVLADAHDTPRRVPGSSSRGAYSKGVLLCVVATVLMGLLVNSIVRRLAPPRYSFLFIPMSFTGVILILNNLYLRQPALRAGT